VKEDIRIRAANAGDHKDIARLYMELKDHHRKLQPRNPRYDVNNERWSEVARAALENPDVFLYVAEAAREVAGFMKITYAQKPWGISCEIETMVVDKRRRGRGIGGRLLEHAETVARERGAKGLRVDVLIPNYEGREFYERAGFEAIAVRYGKPVRD
jgi:ribosomal protein S18 acetylase RimI-like enzyme